MRTCLHAFSVLLLLSAATAAQQRPAPRQVPQRSRPAPGPAYMAEPRSYDEAPLETEARALLEPALEEVAWAREAGLLARGSGDAAAPPERGFGPLLALEFDRRGAGATASGSASGALSISALTEYHRATFIAGRM